MTDHETTRSLLHEAATARPISPPPLDDLLRRGRRHRRLRATMVVATISALTLGLVGGALFLTSDQQTEPVATNYGLAVAVLQSWYEAGTRGDLASDETLRETALATATEAVAARAGEGPYANADMDPRSDGRVVWAVSAPDGAFAYVVQHAHYGDTDDLGVAADSTVPIGVLVWLDGDGNVVKAQIDQPQSGETDASTPESASITSGVWLDSAGTRLLLLETGQSLSYTPGFVTSAALNTSDPLVSVLPDQKAPDLSESGYAVIDLSSDAIPFSFRGRFTNPIAEANEPWLWSPLVSSDYTRYTLNISFMGGSGSSTIGAGPDPFSASEQATAWQESVRDRLDLGPYPIETPSGEGFTRGSLGEDRIQANLPNGGATVLYALVVGPTADNVYIAATRAPDGSMSATTCTDPSSVMTAACRLPDDQGWIFATDVPFTYTTDGTNWEPAAPLTDLTETVAALIRSGPDVKVRLETARGVEEISLH